MTSGGDGSRRVETLGRADAWRRLASVALGRVVFTENALPSIRPVTHLVDQDMIIIRTHLGAAVLPTLGAVVAYEADEIDPDTHVGWSVIVTGVARRVADLDAVTRYERLLRRWVSAETDQMIQIEPRFITGYRLLSDTVEHSGVEHSGVEHTSTDPE